MTGKLRGKGHTARPALLHKRIKAIKAPGALLHELVVGRMRDGPAYATRGKPGQQIGLLGFHPAQDEYLADCSRRGWWERYLPCA